MSEEIDNRSNELRNLLKRLQDGTSDVDTVFKEIQKYAFEDIGFAKIDHQRIHRTGYPEVIYCSGKTLEQIIDIMDKMNQNNHNILATRVLPNMADAICNRFPQAIFNPVSRTISVMKLPLQKTTSKIVIVTAGTSDIPVAEEAFVTAELFGNTVEKIFDVGIAGIHRLFKHIDQIREAKVIIAVAGMEGALPSVLGGLVDKPVIAVPTSIGYGASFNGLSALLTMLNSCAAGISVVNIDNGFGAGYLASMINKLQ